MIALAIALAAETLAALVWAGAAAERLTQLEEQSLRTRVLVERTARLEERAVHIIRMLDRIERKIDTAGQVGQ